MALHPKTEDEVVNAVDESPLAFVKWGATWCGPCKMIQPVFDQLAKKYKDDALFVSIDIDHPEFEQLAQLYKISGVPAFHVFKNGKQVSEFVGANKAKLEHTVATEIELLKNQESDESSD